MSLFRKNKAPKTPPLPHWLTIDPYGYAKIDLRHGPDDAKLRARRVWEALFRLSNAESFGSLDNFLCDLWGIAMAIEEGETELFWSYDRKSGCTNLTTCLYPGDPGFHVSIRYMAQEILIAPTWAE